MKKYHIFGWGAAVVVTLSALFLILSNMAVSASNKSIQIVGHRGAGALAPENTLLAVKAGMKIGVDAIEIDLQRTSDGVIIVLHDESIDRTTNQNGKAIDLSYEQVSEAKVLNEQGEAIDEKIPTLDEVLNLINGKTKLLIEIKQGSKTYPGIEKQVIELVAKHNAQSWCIIQSFEDYILKNAHDLDTSIPLHKLYYGNLLGIGIKRKGLKHYPHITSFNSFGRLTSARFVRKVQKQGKSVFVWTLNSEKQIQKAKQKGVDGIISDRPDLVKSIVQNKS